jgi:hypothetical protein
MNISPNRGIIVAQLENKWRENHKTIENNTIVNISPNCGNKSWNNCHTIWKTNGENDKTTIL